MISVISFMAMLVRILYIARLPSLFHMERLKTQIKTSCPLSDPL